MSGSPRRSDRQFCALSEDLEWRYGVILSFAGFLERGDELNVGK
jgi:hypothetical protein